MNIDLKTITAKIVPLLQKLKRYGTFSVVIVFLLVYAGLVLRINMLSNRKPSDDAVSAKLQSVQRPQIDQSVLKKIQALEDQNVQVQALFKQARDNPFSE